MAVDPVVVLLVDVARMSADRSTRDSDRLAPESFCLVLDKQGAASTGKTRRDSGDSRLDSAYGYQGTKRADVTGG